MLGWQREPADGIMCTLCLRSKGRSASHYAKMALLGAHMNRLSSTLSFLAMFPFRDNLPSKSQRELLVEAHSKFDDPPFVDQCRKAFHSLQPFLECQTGFRSPVVPSIAPALTPQARPFPHPSTSHQNIFLMDLAVLYNNLGVTYMTQEATATTAFTYFQAQSLLFLCDYHYVSAEFVKCTSVYALILTLWCLQLAELVWPRFALSFSDWYYKLTFRHNIACSLHRLHPQGHKPEY